MAGSSWTNQLVNTLIVGGPNAGMFLYNGTPKAGNPPVLAAVAPGTTKDPFGNTVSAVLNIGNVSAAHAGFDSAGIEYLADSTGTPRIVLDPGKRLIEFLSASGLGSVPLLTIASAAGSDSFGGGAFPAGIGLNGLPITAGNTIINTSGQVGYSATPAANNMLYSDAPAQFTDAFGNLVLSGVTTYGKSGITYYALNQLPGSDAAGLFGAVTTVYTATSQAGPWTAGSQLNLAGTNRAGLLADVAHVYGVSTAPVFQLHSGAALLSASAAMTANAQGTLAIQGATTLKGNVPVVQTDISTHAAGNDALAHDITRAWSIPAGDAATGTTYTIRALVTVNTGQTTIQTLTLGADIAGTVTNLATLGVSFNGGALNTTYAIPVELVMIVDAVSAGTPEVYLNAPLGDTAANRLSTNSVNMQGFSHTAAFAAGTGGTYALSATWGGAGGSAQNAQTIASRFYREGP